MALTREQQSNIERALRVARKKRATPKVRKALIEAMGVESNYRHLKYGDRDSVGVLQQRPSQGWGPASESVEQDVSQFIDRAMKVRHKYGTAGELAQAVQRSAFPERYDQRSSEANRILRGSPSVGAPQRVERGQPPAPQSTAPQVDRRGAQLQYLQNRGRPDALLNLAVSLREPPEEVAVERAAKKFRKKGEGPSGRSRASIVQIGKLAQRMGLRVSEHPAFDKVDPVHTKGSYHYRNAAVDVSGDPDAMSRFARAVARRYGRNLEELIYRGRGGVTIKHGKRVPSSFYSGHTSHVHVAEDD
jgi:hypothetical protein